jgi:hypothetical protein
MLCAAIVVTAFAGPASAVFKCTTAKGVVYQDRPCREGNESDVRITVPTGELAPKGTPAIDDVVTPSHARPDDRTQAVKLVQQSGDAPTAKPAAPKAEGGAREADGRRKDAPVALERTTPMTGDQARTTEPSAKYYSTESFSAGSQTPMQMNCESPSGERRTFYLSDGKLTSI